MNKGDLIQMLQEIRFLHDIDPAHLEQIAKIAQICDFCADDVVFREGQVAEHVYLVVYGKLSLELSPSTIYRKHLVSVLPADHSLKLPEGTQLVEKGIAVNPAYGPVPMEGFVTSSYHSAALGRSFGLALIQNGRNRIGETLQASVGDQLVDVVVGETVLFDAEGTRKDG